MWFKDIIADIGGRLVPFEVKYRGQNVGSGELESRRRAEIAVTTVQSLLFKNNLRFLDPVRA
jgi:hypothetical protein